MSRGSRTDGSRLDHVADGEALDGLVLGGAASAVGAAHGLDVAAAILVTTAEEIPISVGVPSRTVHFTISSLRSKLIRPSMRVGRLLRMVLS